MFELNRQKKFNRRGVKGNKNGREGRLSINKNAAAVMSESLISGESQNSTIQITAEESLECIKQTIHQISGGRCGCCNTRILWISKQEGLDGECVNELKKKGGKID